MVRRESRPSTIGHITLGTKQTGAPSAGNPHAGCDVAGAGNGFTVWLLRHSQRKRGAMARLNLRNTAPVLDPTGMRSLMRFLPQIDNVLEQYSIEVESGPGLFERCSPRGFSHRNPKPTGLGMVSIFRTSAARTLLAGCCRDDACGFRLQPGRTGRGTWLLQALAWQPRLQSYKGCCIQISNSVTVGLC